MYTNSEEYTAPEYTAREEDTFVEPAIEDMGSRNSTKSFDPPGINAYLEEEQGDYVHPSASFGEGGSINTIASLGDSGSGSINTVNNKEEGSRPSSAFIPFCRPCGNVPN